MVATRTTGNKLIYLTRCILVLLHTHKTPLFLVFFLVCDNKVYMQSAIGKVYLDRKSKCTEI